MSCNKLNNNLQMIENKTLRLQIIKNRINYQIGNSIKRLCTKCSVKNKYRHYDSFSRKCEIASP